MMMILLSIETEDCDGDDDFDGDGEDDVGGDDDYDDDDDVDDNDDSVTIISVAATKPDLTCKQ